MTKEQERIDAELELEMIPIRKENKKAFIQGISFLSFLWIFLWLMKYKIYLLPLLLA